MSDAPTLHNTAIAHVVVQHHVAWPLGLRLSGHVSEQLVS
jgi:hypothetical protein